MSEQPFLLEDAPSIGDIVSASGRVGTVDFSAPPEPDAEPDAAPPTTGLFDTDDDPSEAEELALLVSATNRRPELGDARASTRSVAEVAAAVTERMRAVESAHERHVEAIELEAARRCELLTAQAELDAELIRLHARREAHAIIATARQSDGDELLDEAAQLEEIGETFSRFAESIEVTVSSAPQTPDSDRWS